MSDERPFYSSRRRLAAIPTTPGPEKRHVASGEQLEELKQIRALTGTLGKKVELAAVGIWSGLYYPEGVDENRVAEAVCSVRQDLPVGTKTLLKNADLSPYYQALTNPPPEGIVQSALPTHEGLAYLFKAARRHFNTNLPGMFKDIGSAYSDTGRTIQQPVSPHFRYLVSTALVIGKLVTEPQYAIPQSTTLIPDQRIYHPGTENRETKQATQFDGVVVPARIVAFLQRDFDMDRYWRSGFPWAFLEIKFPLRAREVTGRISNPFRSDVTGVQDKLGRAILARKGMPFTFPEYISLAYLRGMKPSVYHFVHVDYNFLSDWHNNLWHKMDSGYYSDAELGSAAYVREIIKEEIGRNERRFQLSIGHPLDNNKEGVPLENQRLL